MSTEKYSVYILRKVVIDAVLFCILICSLYASSCWLKTFQRGFFCGDESLMYPYHGDTVNVPLLRVVGLGLPVVAFILCEWTLLRLEGSPQNCFGLKIPVWVLGVYCSLVSFFMGYCFVEFTTNIAKNVIGRPRPHFFDICQPSVNCSTEKWRNRYIQSSDYTCTGAYKDKFEDMRKSFLSGHSSVAAYCMVYLALYLHSRMSWRGTRMLRHCLQFVALMLSWFTALSRISDFKHHWSDVLAGYSLGTFVAVIVWTQCTDLIQRKKLNAQLQQPDIHLTQEGASNKI